MNQSQPMIAIKPMTYATRHLQAGEPFNAEPHHVRGLVAIKKARSAAEDDVTVPVATATPKRGRGRPAGAKNKPKA